MRSALVPSDAARLARPATATGLVLALVVLPLLAALPIDITPLAGALVKWLVVAGVVAIIRGAEHRPLSSAGLRRPSPVDGLWAVGVAALGVAAFIVTTPVITALGLPTQDGLVQPSLVVGLAAALTAGITEELLFRGYPIERLTDAGYSPLVAGGVTWLVFTVAHLPSYPAGTVVQIGLAALVFTAAYVRTRSLAPVMAGHVLLDVVGVLAYHFT